MNQLLKNAKKILLENRRSGYTLPTNNKLYPAQWNWDSAFIALGYSYFNLDYAIEEINTLLKVNGRMEWFPTYFFIIKILTIILIIPLGIVVIKLALQE